MNWRTPLTLLALLSLLFGAPPSEAVDTGIATTSPPTYTSGQVSPLSLDTAGNLRVNLAAGGGSGGTAMSDQGTFTQGTTSFTPIGGEFNTTFTNLSSGQAGAAAMTTDRMLYVNIGKIAGTTVVTAAGGVLKVGIVGNTGAAMDAAGQNATSPANELLVAAQFNTTPTTLTSGNMSPLQMDSAENLLVNIKAGAGSGGTALADQAAFTQGTTNFTPAGCEFNTAPTALASGTAGAFLCNANRALNVVGVDTTVASTALGALNAAINIVLAGQNGATFQLQSAGTGVYTVTPGCSFDGGTIYNANGFFQDPGAGIRSATATIASGQATTDFQVYCPQGSSHAQVKVTSYTSGTANWLARATMGAWPTVVFPVETSAQAGTNATVDFPSLTTLRSLRQDLASVAGTAISVNVGAAGAGTPRVVDVASGTTGAAVPAQSSYVGGQGSGNLTGITVCDTKVNINQTAGAQLITGTASKNVFVCGINVVTATAQNLALVEGTGTTCATGIAGMAGGTTAATGWNLAANGGLTQGTGLGWLTKTTTAADNVCLLQSGTGQVSGVLTYTIQ